MNVRELIAELVKEDMNDTVYVRIDTSDVPEYKNEGHFFLFADGIAIASYSKKFRDGTPEEFHCCTLLTNTH